MLTISHLPSTKSPSAVCGPHLFQWSGRTKASSLAALADLDLGFAGSHFYRHPIHAALAQLDLGSPLQLQPRGSQIVLPLDEYQQC